MRIKSIHRGIQSFLLPVIILLSLGGYSGETISSQSTHPHSIADFASQPSLTRARISPSGKYLAGVFYVNGAQAVFVDEILAQEKPFVSSGNEWKINWLSWASDEDLLLGVSIPSQRMGTPLTITRLISIDMKSRKSTLMFRREEAMGFWQIQDSVIGMIPSKPGEFLVTARTNGSRPGVHRVKSGASKLRKVVVQGRLKDVYDWQSDKLGNVRVGLGFTADQKKGVLKLRDKNKKWHDHSALLTRDAEVLAMPTDNLSHYLVNMMTETSSHQTDLELETQQSTKKQLIHNKDSFRKVFLFDAETGEENVIYEHERSEVSTIITDKLGSNILEVKFSGEDIPPLVVDPQRALLDRAFKKNFENATAYVISESDDRSMALIAVDGPQTAVDYYFYMAKDKKLNFLRSAYQNLEPEKLSPVHDVAFHARDGLLIPGYITLPLGLTPDTAKNLPLIVHPHGGPYARDFKRFDWLVQMLAAQGYAVLQINFRGSTGYGKAFEAAGYKEWGQAMQDDITDGTHWVIKEGIADSTRVAIVGGSYGGYAALMGAAKEPSLYRCAVSFNGVTDLQSLLSNSRRYIGGKFGTRFIGNLWADRKKLKANSPINLVNSITSPVLLMHGEKDRVVDVKQSRRMFKALQTSSNTEIDYLELIGGDHNLSGYNNRIKFAETLLKFLKKHLSSATQEDNI